MPTSALHFFYAETGLPMGSLMPDGDQHRVCKIAFVPDADVEMVYEALQSTDHETLLQYALLYTYVPTRRTPPAAPPAAAPCTQHASLHGGQGYTLQEQATTGESAEAPSPNDLLL